MEKIRHLERKWKRVEKRRRGGNPDVAGVWRGIKIGEEELKEEEEKRGERSLS